MSDPHSKTAASGRDASGRLLPGHTANPGGRERLPEEFKVRGPARFAAIQAIAEDPEHKRNYEALVWCLERQYGKAPTAPEDEEMTASWHQMLARFMGEKAPP